MEQNATSITGILNMATQVVTWLVETMQSYLKFVTDNPIILVGMLIMLAGLGVGMLFRIMKSA